MITEQRKAELKKLINEDDIVLLMKGDASFPQCGFSARVVHVLKSLETKFSTIDILQDDELRADIKEYSQWPTFPQLYIKGEFIGGCDIVCEMAVNGELKELIH